MSEVLKISDLFDLSHTVMGCFLEKLVYGHEALPHIGTWIALLGRTLSPHSYDRVGESIWIAKSANVAPNARIIGPAIIGEEAEVRHNAFLRGRVVLGKGTVVGNACELKNAILLDGAKAPHYNYVGDSILGYMAHLGAGAVISNLKSDGGEVTVRSAGGEGLATGLRKVGAMVGDHAEIGCGAVLNPGTVVGRGSVVYPLSSVRGQIPERMILKGRGELVPRRSQPDFS